MATQPEKRRKAILAVLLALIAAGTLCVWGAAAAGFSISSPVIDAIVSVFTPTGRTADGGADGDGTVDISLPGDGGTGGDGGDGDGDGEDGGDGGDGDVADGSNCLLGILCLNASADASANGGSDGEDGATNISLNADASTEDAATNCFLGLICLTADAATQDGVDSVINANADGDGIDLDADADVDEDDLLDGVLDTDDDNSCLLGVVCLDGESSNADAGATISATLNSWWNSFARLFADAEAS